LKRTDTKGKLRWYQTSDVQRGYGKHALNCTIGQASGKC